MSAITYEVVGDSAETPWRDALGSCARTWSYALVAFSEGQHVYTMIPVELVRGTAPWRDGFVPPDEWRCDHTAVHQIMRDFQTAAEARLLLTA